MRWIEARLTAEDAAAAARRPARTPTEEHAVRALVQLAAADSDHARERNGEGFAASTQDGHRLAARVAEFGGLLKRALPLIISPFQWSKRDRLRRRAAALETRAGVLLTI